MNEGKIHGSEAADKMHRINIITAGIILLLATEDIYVMRIKNPKALVELCENGCP